MSHHGDAFPPSEDGSLEKFRAALVDETRAAQRLLQGEFPDGRLNADDQGSVAVTVGHEKGKVVLVFPHPTTWVGFTPNQAMDIAQTLIKHARQAGIVGVYEIKL